MPPRADGFSPARSLKDQTTEPEERTTQMATQTQIVRGVEFVHEVDSGFCVQVFFHDPDGNMLALHHRYEPRAEG